VKDGEAKGSSPVSAIVLQRTSRQLIGPGGAVVELPWLSMQLLIALHEHAPQFVDARRLQELVWPDTHISPDALKQRVRLARQALREAGYDPAVLDSVRGEGYALRLPLAEPADLVARDPLPLPLPLAPRASSSYQSSWWRRWRIAIMAALIFSAALVAERFGTWTRAEQGRVSGAAPVIGPVPVRVALLRDTTSNASVSEALEALTQSARRTFAAHADVLLIPRDAGTSCTDGPPAHLCAHISGSTDELRLDVTDLRSGTALVVGTWPHSAGNADVLLNSPQAAQLAVLVSPGTLRWIGEPAGRGDRDFATLLRAVNAATTCDRVAWRDAVGELDVTAERAPQFHVARALGALLAVAVAGSDTELTDTDSTDAGIATALADAEQLLQDDPGQTLAQAARWLAAVQQLPASEVSTAAEAERSAEFRRMRRLSPGVAWLAEHLRSCSARTSASGPEV
jgi:DNA-binding winged helix-turn-helix (wHTH) protein